MEGLNNLLSQMSKKFIDLSKEKKLWLHQKNYLNNPYVWCISNSNYLISFDIEYEDEDDSIPYEILGCLHKEYYGNLKYETVLYDIKQKREIMSINDFIEWVYYLIF